MWNHCNMYLVLVLCCFFGPAFNVRRNVYKWLERPNEAIHQWSCRGQENPMMKYYTNSVRIPDFSSLLLHPAFSKDVKNCPVSNNTILHICRTCIEKNNVCVITHSSDSSTLSSLIAGTAYTAAIIFLLLYTRSFQVLLCNPTQVLCSELEKVMYYSNIFWYYYSTWPFQVQSKGLGWVCIRELEMILYKVIKRRLLQCKLRPQ